MPIYTVEDKETGKRITFEWKGPQPPTQKDMEEIFLSARKQSTAPSPPSLPQAPEELPLSTPSMAETELRKLPPWYETAMRYLPRVGGSILGGLALSPFGPAGIATGAALGGMGGEALEQLRESLFEPRKRPFMQRLETVAKAGTEEFLGAGMGVLGAKAVGKVLAPFARKVSPEAQRAIDTLKSEITPALLPSEATESRMLDILENIAEGSLLGGGKISAFKLKRAEVIKNMADDIVDLFGKRATPDEVGELFISAVENRWNNFKRVVTDPIYNTIAEQSKGVKIDITPLKDYCRPIAETSKILKGIEAKNAGDDIVRKILRMDDLLDFDVAKELRTRLMSRVDEFSIINKKAKAIGKANALISMLDKQIEKGLEKSNPQLLSLFREANRLYKEGSEQFNNRIIRAIIKKGDMDYGGSPELVAQAIFKPGAVTRIRLVKDAVDKDTWKQLQSVYLQSLINNSINPVTGEISGTKMLQAMYGKGGMGEQALKEIFTPQQFKAIDDFANAAKFAEGLSKEGTGRVWIQLVQAGAAPTLIGFGKTKGAAAIMFGPPILSRLMLEPHIVKLLTIGYKLPPSSPQVASIMSRIAIAVNEIENERKRQAMEEERERLSKEEAELVNELTPKRSFSLLP